MMLGSTQLLGLWSLAFVTVPALPLTSYQANFPWLAAEVDYLAQLKSHVTGSPNHKKLIARIEAQLAELGLETQSDVYEFDYYDAPKSPPQLTIDGVSVVPSMYIPYSGVTGSGGVSGELVKLDSPARGGPAWSEASGKIAVLNITCGPSDTSKVLAVWSGSPEWGISGCVPASIANNAVNLTNAAEAGVKAVIYFWEGVTAGNVFGQYGPFKMLPQDVPAVYLAGEAATNVVKAAEAGAPATLLLEGSFVPNITTRTFWTTIPGTEIQNETVVYTTHTDGSNVVQENGYLALLAQAKELVAHPPRRTTILLFLTGHLHTPAVSATGRVLYRWMQDHPDLWNGTNGGPKLVFGSTVEHLGAVGWHDNLKQDFYYSTGSPEQEMLFAATDQLASLLQKVWVGANPAQLRISNPIKSVLEQPGEGLPYLWNQIPEVSLVSAPDWLLKEWPEDFDERQLIDLDAAKRQMGSFLRLWKAVDELDASQFGVVSYTRGPTAG